MIQRTLSSDQLLDSETLSEQPQTQVEEKIIKDSFGNTLLHKAADAWDIAAAKRLLKSNANLLDVKNAVGGTALFKIIDYYRIYRPSRKDKEILAFQFVNFLIEEGADLDVVAAEGVALHAAVRAQSFKLVQLLVEAKANLDVQYHGFGHDRTPLNLAIYRKEKSIAEFLISAGAKLTVEDADGYSPLHYLVDPTDPAKAKADIPVLSSQVSENTRFRPELVDIIVSYSLDFTFFKSAPVQQSNQSVLVNRPKPS